MWDCSKSLSFFDGINSSKKLTNEFREDLRVNMNFFPICKSVRLLGNFPIMLTLLDRSISMKLIFKRYSIYNITRRLFVMFYQAVWRAKSMMKCV